MPELGEPQIRLLAFVGLFAIFAALEVAFPRRRLVHSKSRRWFTNFTIVVIDTISLRIIPFGLAMGAAQWAQHNGYGLFNSLPMPFWLSAIFGFLVLDFAIWFSHWASHKVPVLWAIHRMHHTDVDIDVSTAIRFHPFEIFLSMAFKILVVTAVGIPAVVVLVFEIVLNGVAMFNHSNMRIPPKIEVWARWLIVTPDMHRVHHSIVHQETDSNYGFNLPVWDRLFGTYVAQPREGHENMTIGLSEWQDDRPMRLFWCLKVPFLRSRS